MSEDYWVTGTMNRTSCGEATSTVVSHPPLIHGRFHGLPHWEVWKIEGGNEQVKTAAKCRFLVRRRKACVLQNNDSSLQLKPLCRGEQKTDRAGVMSGNEEEKRSKLAV